MTLLERHDQLIRKKIATMPQGREAGLAAIFGDDWEQIGTTGQRRNFGRLFKAAALETAYPEIEWVGIKNSGRFDVYRKL